ncbi:MAG: MFS transporter [Myxococcota bacterium]
MPRSDFRRFVGSILLSLLADQLFLVTLTWAALRGRPTPMTLGSVLTIAALARALGTPLGGILADRHGAGPTLRRFYTVRGAVLAMAAAFTGIGGEPSTSALYAIALAVGLLAGLVVSPQMTAIPGLVAPTALARSNAIVQGTIQISVVVGPPLAGFSLAHLAVGGSWGVSASLAVGAGLGLGRVTISGPSQRPDEASGPPLRRILQQHPVLWSVLVVMGLVYLGLMGPVQVGIPARVQQTLGDDPRTLGLLLGCFGAGMLTGTVVAARVDCPPRVGLHLLAAVALIAAGLAVVGLGAHRGAGAPGAAAGLVLAGLGMGYFNVTGVSWLHRAIPRAAQGRVIGLVMLSANATAPLSPLLAGWLAEDAVDPVFFIGAAVVGSAALVGLALPSLRRLTQVHPPADEESAVRPMGAPDKSP